MRILTALAVFVLTTTCAMAAMQPVHFSSDRDLLKISHSGVLRPGDKLDLSVRGLNKNDVLYVQRCLRQCASAEVVAAFAGKDAADQDVSVTIATAGQYVVWIQRDQGYWNSYEACLTSFEPRDQHFSARFKRGVRISGEIHTRS